MSRLHVVPDLPPERVDPFTLDAAKVLGCWLSVLAWGVAVFGAIGVVIWRLVR